MCAPIFPFFPLLPLPSNALKFYYHFISVGRTPFSQPSRIYLPTTTSFSFSSSEKLLISPSFLKNSFPRYKIYNWQFFPSSTWKCGATSFWPPSFQMRNLLSSELIFPYRKSIVFLWLLSRLFSFSLVFKILIIMCLGMNLNVFAFPSCVFIFQSYKDIFWSYSQWMPFFFSSKSANKFIWSSFPLSTTY